MLVGGQVFSIIDSLCHLIFMKEWSKRTSLSSQRHNKTSVNCPLTYLVTYLDYNKSDKSTAKGDTTEHALLLWISMAVYLKMRTYAERKFHELAKI